MSNDYTVARITYIESGAEIRFDDDLLIKPEIKNLCTGLFPLWVKKEVNAGNLRFVEKLRDTAFEFILFAAGEGVYKGVVIADLPPYEEEHDTGVAVNPKNITDKKKSSKKPVLIVDDNEHARIIVGGMLKKLGLRFDLAVNGKEAVEKAREKEYSVILMDLSMPVMDGFGATVAIRDTFPEPACNVPILALTAASFAEMSEQVYSSGMNGYLAKPVKLEELLAAIEPYIIDAKLPSVSDNPADLFVVTGSMDLSYLKDVSRGDLKFASDIIVSFLQSHARLLADIRYTLSVGDIKKCREHCHKLKPVFGYLGLNQIIPLIEKFHSALHRPGFDRHAQTILLERISGLTATAAGDLKEIHLKMLKHIG